MKVDLEILKACAKDDRKAINQLYEQCFHHLMPVCFRYNNNEEDARSAYNQGFIKILNSLKKIDLDINFGAWSKRIMVNHLIDEYRKNKRYNTQISKSDDERILEYHSSGVDNDAQSNLGCENIMALIQELPQTTALVFNLYVVEGYNHREIADKIGISEGTSKWHLSTARKSLREKLEKLESIKERIAI